MDANPTVPPAPVLPELPYSLRDRKRSIALFWTLFVIDTLAQPLILYFTLWYLTDLSHNLVFTISTAALGGVSIGEYFYRFWILFKKDSVCRPLNARRSWLDFFQINFTLVWVILGVELIIGTVQEEPYIRLLAMPLPTFMYYFGIVHLTLDFLRARGYQAPFRISSTPKGHVMPTALYVLIEDIVAVDGGGGQKYRRALRDRYLASPYFRQMLFEMNCFWGGGSIVWATIITILIFTTPRDVAYTLGWTLPFVWAGLWTIITIPWVQADLRREKAAWAKGNTHGGEPFTDDIHEPTPLTRFVSVSGRLASMLPFHKPGARRLDLEGGGNADTEIANTSTAGVTNPEYKQEG
ncbi:conserved hypothetical protein [Uncinocarpus reesii 1704]|uniref:Uncharacterized protein n=1 Tax=Uncinocarpus reesii (strain UAMH 1704) TaxID=336963 RepID=C4JUL5_UNCRE|nr:uncharacterized protein UREG_04818 [Uncinocarpus reesii 1704]EEP79976.1 conserved hypothetical protein [Uncinocarpus reesii 1704]